MAECEAALLDVMKCDVFTSEPWRRACCTVYIRVTRTNMKVLLVGNYLGARQESMQRFAEMLRGALVEAGHEVRLTRPPLILGRFLSSDRGIGKWVGYLDRFLIYPLLLVFYAQWADVVHICDQANSVYIPRLHRKPQIITCHDVLAIRSALGEIAEAPTGWTGRILQRWITRTLRTARVVACVSEQTSTEVKRVVGLDGSRLKVVPNALNYPYKPMVKNEAVALLRQMGIDTSIPFLLHVGGNQWYKNRLGVLRIFSEIRHIYGQEIRLIMVGKSWTVEMRRVACDLGLVRCVIALNNVSNSRLCALYSVAQMLLFPSLQEGYGWPVAEAFACGCPVATSRRSPMTEVGGNAAVYFEPDDEKGAAVIIANALEQRDRWAAVGLKQAASFSLPSMVAGYVGCYQAAIEDFQRSGARDE